MSGFCTEAGGSPRVSLDPPDRTAFLATSHHITWLWLPDYQEMVMGHGHTQTTLRDGNLEDGTHSEDCVMKLRVLARF